MLINGSRITATLELVVVAQIRIFANGLEANIFNVSRVNSTSVVKARFFASKTAKPNHYSSNARTPVGSHGQRFIGGSIRKVSPRCVTLFLAQDTRLMQSIPISSPSLAVRTSPPWTFTVGASLEVIKERRAQRPEARAAARQAAIKEGKEKKTESESKKKAEKAKSAAAGARGQPGRIASKMGAKGAASKVNAKTR